MSRRAAPKANTAARQREGSPVSRRATDRPNGAAPALLEFSGLQSGYVRRDVLRGVSFSVGAGELVALLGHNGAGKTTTLKTAVGLLPTRGGDIRFDGGSLAGKSTTERMGLGLRLLPEGRGIFPVLTVEENIDVIERAARSDTDWLFRRDDIYRFFPILANKRHQPAGQLSGGQQQMLAVGLALVGRPRCILLDEPSIGLAPLIVEEIFSRIRSICTEHGVAALLVEQNVKAVLEVADRIVILNNGSLVFNGTADEARDTDFWKYF
jgi:ABC-type branched-subunit amino acid transport system ATPase component